MCAMMIGTKHFYWKWISTVVHTSNTRIYKDNIFLEKGVLKKSSNFHRKFGIQCHESCWKSRNVLEWQFLITSVRNNYHLWLYWINFDILTNITFSLHTIYIANCTTFLTFIYFRMNFQHLNQLYISHFKTFKIR